MKGFFLNCSLLNSPSDSSLFFRLSGRLIEASNSSVLSSFNGLSNTRVSLKVEWNALQSLDRDKSLALAIIEAEA